MDGLERSSTSVLRGWRYGRTTKVTKVIWLLRSFVPIILTMREIQSVVGIGLIESMGVSLQLVPQDL